MSEELVPEVPDGTRINIVGLGGVGGVVAKYLSRFLNHTEKLVTLSLIDGDEYEPRNAERQEFSTIGNKAEVAARDIKNSIGEHTNMRVVSIDEFVDPMNVEDLFVEGSINFLCVDDHGARKLISDRCSNLDNCVVISGGNHGVEPPHEIGTFGNVQVHVRKDGKDITSPITKFHPEIDEAIPKENPGMMGCSANESSVPQILFANLTVGAAMCNAFYSTICGVLDYQECQFDIIKAQMQPMLKREPIGYVLGSEPEE